MCLQLRFEGVMSNANGEVLIEPMDGSSGAVVVRGRRRNLAAGAVARGRGAKEDNVWLVAHGKLNPVRSSTGLTRRLLVWRRPSVLPGQELVVLSDIQTGAIAAAEV